MDETHIEHCIYLLPQRKKKATTIINGNIKALQYIITKKVKSNPKTAQLSRQFSLDKSYQVEISEASRREFSWTI